MERAKSTLDEHQLVCADAVTRPAANSANDRRGRSRERAVRLGAVIETYGQRLVSTLLPVQKGRFGAPLGVLSPISDDCVGFRCDCRVHWCGCERRFLLSPHRLVHQRGGGTSGGHTGRRLLEPAVYSGGPRPGRKGEHAGKNKAETLSPEMTGATRSAETARALIRKTKRATRRRFPAQGAYPRPLILKLVSGEGYYCDGQNPMRCDMNTEVNKENALLETPEISQAINSGWVARDDRPLGVTNSATAEFPVFCIVHTSASFPRQA